MAPAASRTWLPLRRKYKGLTIHGVGIAGTITSCPVSPAASKPRCKHSVLSVPLKHEATSRSTDPLNTSRRLLNTRLGRVATLSWSRNSTARARILLSVSGGDRNGTLE